MARYIAQRLVLMVITLFVIVSVSFFVLHSMPGSFINDPRMPKEVKKAIEDKYHLNEPLIVQYGYFLKDFVRLDFGISIALQPKVNVNKILATKIPVSMQVNIFSLILSIPVGIILGIWAALKKNKIPDHVISILIIAFISIPSFVFASLLQYFIAFKLGWFPIVVTTEQTLTWSKFVSMVLPILALSFGSIAGIARYTRAELCEALNSEYMLLAKSKGLTQVQATTRHAMRNSFIPLANIIIPMFTGIMGGSLVIEKIFSIPGMGSVMVEAINAKDYPVAMGVLFWYSLVGLLTILIVDLSYGIIDPRIRIGGRK
ncbi:ABC transporter permease [Tepidimicrobium xylanilyticum]|uniref:Oligopeptide transport system permease protein n=1 Tax=Tepidimicrobium xylanilyticum TaxID=1123352 RepID=A0A1H3ASC4_9FIRM|nr:ABC transporter permease [Tepidimicrobium xylanilyticum]NLW41496.1 ABC transporter permease [Tissierellia bacterium]GMG97646.1 peptide ABC transporter permease [Tepidimicrobium xylanilyticum]SDX32576.1 oligopeptide transport system permease protein [Tepidimicrobium xylanilyticum]